MHDTNYNLENEEDVWTFAANPTNEHDSPASAIDSAIQESRKAVLADKWLTNTERRMVEENPGVDPFELLDSVSDYELS